MSEWNTGIGVMSGTSLDGLDLVCCRFLEVKENIRFGILSARTIPFSSEWRERLVFDEHISGFDLKKLDLEFGTFIGDSINRFIEEENLQPDFIASHGHTWFHDPNVRMNYQLGDGSEIYNVTRIPVVNDFRSLDIRMKGQGAPLVPVGDELLFSQYDCCVNLGGIANISGKKDRMRTSFDVVPFNLVLNLLANRLDLPYDRDGLQASQGKNDPAFREALGSFAYFDQTPPKSLGIEWVKNEIYPVIKRFDQLSTQDLLCTYVAFCCEQLVNSIGFFDKCEKILITGGGAHNGYFISSLKELIGEGSTIVVPGAEIVDFKEALIFAFLGKLRLENKVNCLKEVTGAASSVSGGIVYDNYIE
ncbi:MAG: anhydro-N-acetylmuramic acid kinase [Cyclobacteriaceae bacterium]